MKDFIKKHPLVTILLFLLIGPASLNYSGFCIAQGRYLSDEEKIRLVFEYQNNRGTLPIGPNNYKQIRYKNFEEFKERNPDCCRVITMVPSGDFIDRISGYDLNDIISISYVAYYVNGQGYQESQQISFNNFLTNCGQVH